MQTDGQANQLGEIEVGFSTAQAAAIVREIDVLWANSNHNGKKKVKELRRLQETLSAAIKIEEAL